MMNILLEELPHQEQALAAILASFTGIGSRAGRS
ncbi:Type III restriction-modification system enzyme [Salmonella enterica subsp. enterica serovar Goldcoast]|nr:Type III restriction-modification system enzyme [Salmonella enterica subsp. enterica serovar Goldcoast]